MIIHLIPSYLIIHANQILNPLSNIPNFYLLNQHLCGILKFLNTQNPHKPTTHGHDAISIFSQYFHNIFHKWENIPLAHGCN